MGLQITFIFIIDYFLNYLINWFVYKISEKKWESFHYHFPEPKLTSTSLLIMSAQQSKTQIYSVYRHIRQPKSANSHIGEAKQ